MTKKELQRQIDDLRDRVEFLENKNYCSRDTYPPMVQPLSQADPFPFPSRTTTQVLHNT
jgi:hypothetical protein